MAKVVFVQDIIYEYFGVMYMSAYLKENGHDCDVIIEYAEKDWLRKLKDSGADIAAFSVLTGSYKWALSRAEIIKEKLGLPILFGGTHVYLNTTDTIKEPMIDMICTGEGEVPLKELCDSIDSGGIDTGIRGFWFKNGNGEIIKNPPAPLINDLNSLPFADRTIYYKYPAIANRTTLPILGSRGCPYTCSYCVIPSAKKVFEGLGKFVRERSPENIMSEVEYCLSLSKKKELVHFVEDHFGNNRQLSLKTLKAISALKGGKMTWGGAIRVERFIKEEYVRELSKTNHGVLGIAVECGDEDFRREVLSRPVTNAQIIEAADLARKYGIRFVTLNMVGLPGETFEQAVKTLELNIRIKPKYANCYVYQPYPGTILQQYAVEHKLIDSSVSSNLGLSFYDRYWKNNRELNRIINIQRIFALVVQYPFLKRPMLALARGNWKLTLDMIFGLHYLWYLTYHFKLKPLQIIQLVKLWVRSKFSFKSSPADQSIKQGEGQLYPSMGKAANVTA